MKNNAETISYIKANHASDAAKLFFIIKVWPHGDWDFKRQNSWNLNSATTYIYHGQVLRFDDIGNIHYGYVGRVIFKEKTLLKAGGLLQIAAFTSKKEYKSSNYDDPRDQWAISFGAKLWDEGGI